jgi:hypothetical protein
MKILDATGLSRGVSRWRLGRDSEPKEHRDDSTGQGPVASDLASDR